MAALYGALFAGVGVHIPFFPVWLEARGLDAGQIGTVLAAPFIVRLIGIPLLAYLADRLGRTAVSLGLYALASAGLFLSLALAPGFVAVLVLAAAATVFMGALMPLVEAAAMGLVAGGRASYGRLRLWGSVTFIATSLAGGLALERYSAGVILWLLAASLAAVALCGAGLPQKRGMRQEMVPGFATVGRLFTRTPLVALVLGAGCLQASHAVYYGFASLHWQGQGLSGPVVGALWAWGVAAEIAMFWLAGPRGRAGLMLVGGVFSVLRWTGMGFDPPLWAVAVLQTGHAFSFAAVNIGLVTAVAALAPEGLRATAQAMSSTLAGLVMAGALLTSGPLYAALGGQAYWAMAALALAGTGLVALSVRLQPQSAASGG